VTIPTDPAPARGVQDPRDPAAGGAERPQSRSSGIFEWLARVVVDLPTRLPLMFFWLTLVISVAVLVGVFRPVVVVPVTLLAIAACWRVAPERIPATRDAVLSSGTALVGALAWVVVGLRSTAEVLLVERDPGFLTLEGLWLSRHADPDIPIRSAADVLAQVPGTRATSDAFWLDGAVLNAQGAKAFPGLIGALGWLGGQPAVLAANVLVGGLALLAVYDVGRRVLPPVWALLPTAALAMTSPMLYFTRTPFTEPTNIVLTFGGLAVIWDALQQPRLRISRLVLGGAMLGANALSRIDGAAVTAGLVLGLGLVAAGTRESHRRQAMTRGFVAAAGAAVAMVGLGYLDVLVNSPGYLMEHRFVFVPLMALLAACLVAALVALVVVPRVLPWIDRHRARIARLALAGVLVGAVLLASRPLWWQAHLVVPGSGQAAFVGAIQANAGVPVDDTRSYDEQTVTWLAWYLGWGTVVLAAGGAALMAHEAIARRRAPLFVLLATLGVPALLYLLRPSITPDQIWAMRRFLPAVLPLALLCAVWMLRRAAAWANDPSRRDGVRGVTRAALGLASVGMLVAPVFTWGRLVGQAEFAGRAAEVDAMCDQVRGSRVVVVRGAEAPLLPTLRIACDVDVVEVWAPASTEKLAAIRAAWGPGRVLAISGLPGTMPWPADRAPTMTHSIIRWPHTLTPAVWPIPFESSLWIGEVEEAGAVHPLTPGP
jgi:hypothetical protein